MTQIASIEQLREIIPAPSDKAFAKIRDRLCGQGIALIERCPFVILSTIGHGGVEVSQRGGDPASSRSSTTAPLPIPEYWGNQMSKKSDAKLY